MSECLTSNQLSDAYVRLGMNMAKGNSIEHRGGYAHEMVAVSTVLLPKPTALHILNHECHEAMNAMFARSRM